MRLLATLHLRYYRAVVVGVVLATGLALVGLSQVEFDSDPRALFRAKDKQFEQLQELYDDFGPDDQDVQLLIDGDDLFSVPSLVALRNAISEIKKIDGVESVLSIFDIRRAGPIPLLLVPVDFESSPRIERLKSAALSHPMARGQFLSEDGRTTVVSIRLQGHLNVAHLSDVSRQIRETCQQYLSALGMECRQAGHPAVRIAVFETLQSEVFKFAILGAVISGLIAYAVFHSVGVLFITMSGPIIGVLWTVGCMGFFGIPIDPLSVVLPTLLFVVGFTDAVHLVNDMRAARGEGLGRREAAASAIRHIGPACLLTALTTAAGFGSLVIAKTECIQRFGVTCFLGTCITYLAVQLVVPLAAVTRLGHSLDAPQLSTGRSAMRWLNEVYSHLLKQPRSAAVVGVAVTMVCFVTSLQLRSDLRWIESLPESSEIVEVTRKCDQDFGGALFAHVVVEWPVGHDLESPEVLDALQSAHELCDRVDHLKGSSSVLSVLKSLRWKDQTVVDQVRHLGRLPPELQQRFVRLDRRRALVSVHVPDIGAAALLPSFTKIEERFDQLKAQHPGFHFQLTGTVVVAARNVYRIIDDLGRSLTLAGIVIFAMMVLLFRSIFLGVLSLAPNIFPQAITASLLVWCREPLTVSSVLTFSLCLGLSVDDTVHFLMRFIEERKAGGSLRCAVMRTFQAVGGTMIMTSLVLIGGFVAMAASQMPGIRLFAVLSVVTMLAAILGDLVMLPSLLLSFPSFANKRVVGQDSTPGIHSGETALCERDRE